MEQPARDETTRVVRQREGGAQCELRPEREELAEVQLLLEILFKAKAGEGTLWSLHPSHTKLFQDSVGQAPGPPGRGETWNCMYVFLATQCRQRVQIRAESKLVSVSC